MESPVNPTTCPYVGDRPNTDPQCAAQFGGRRGIAGPPNPVRPTTIPVYRCEEVPMTKDEAVAELAAVAVGFEALYA